MQSIFPRVAKFLFTSGWYVRIMEYIDEDRQYTDKKESVAVSHNALLVLYIVYVIHCHLITSCHPCRPYLAQPLASRVYPPSSQQ